MHAIDSNKKSVNSFINWSQWKWLLVRLFFSSFVLYQNRQPNKSHFSQCIHNADRETFNWDISTFYFQFENLHTSKRDYDGCILCLNFVQFYTVCRMKNDINMVFIIPIFSTLDWNSPDHSMHAYVCVCACVSELCTMFVCNRMDDVIWNMIYCCVSIGFQPFSGWLRHLHRSIRNKRLLAKHTTYSQTNVYFDPPRIY